MLKCFREVKEMARKESYAINPLNGEKLYRTSNVMTYGITDQEFATLCEELPNKDIKIYDCSDCFTDIIALPYIAAVLNPDVIDQEAIDYFNDFANEVMHYTEKIIFTRNHPVLKQLNKNVKFTVLEGDLEFKSKIKYILLEALRAEKRNDTYSDTVAQTIRVLSEIRKHPGITTAELAEIIERNTKTVQRYITTLNCAGEFIEYDRKKKGWFLYENKSVLWGDY